MRWSFTGIGHGTIVIGIFIVGMAQQNLFAAPCPCDIYAAGQTPCVAAYSTARALFASYNGPLYHVVRMSDRKTMYINSLSAGGPANASAQDTFLKNTTGKVDTIYDQSGNNNHLTRGTPGCTVNSPDSLSPASAAVTLFGKKVYGLYMSNGEGYRSGPKGAAGKNVPTGTTPQGAYWVVNGKRYWGSGCCWDFGNAETNNCYGPTGTMASLYFGSMSYWGTGTGNGPWLMGDFEGGLFPGGTTASKGYASNPSITFDYLTGILKVTSTPQASYALRYGNAQSGSLTTIYNGKAPTTWKLEGSIVLGIGGDNSNGSGTGNFYEGALTNGYPPDTTEDAVQAEIAGVYSGKVRTIGNDADRVTLSAPHETRYGPSTSSVYIRYYVPQAGRVHLNVFDQRGRSVATPVNQAVPAGYQRAVWDAGRVAPGIYLWKMMVDGKENGAGRIVIGK
jgi:non-reducing end alpha-L-arabinofuranosidase